jgi:hypothetical protein
MRVTTSPTGDASPVFRRPGLELEAEVAGRVPRRGDGVAVLRTAPDAEVRRAELGEHLPDDVVELVLDLGVDRHVAILLAHRGPVDAVHLGVVEVVAHRGPGLVEEVGQFLLLLDLHRTDERHLLAGLDGVRRLDAPDAVAVRAAVGREVDVVAAPARALSVARDQHALAAVALDDVETAAAAADRHEALVDQHLAVRREARDLVEAGALADPANVPAVHVHDVDRRAAAARAVERDVLAVGRERRVVVAARVARELLGRSRLDVDQPDVAVAAPFGAEHDRLAVRRPVEEEVVLGVLRELPCLLRAEVVDEDVGVARAVALERELGTVRRPARPFLLGGAGDDAAALAAGGRHDPDVAAQGEGRVTAVHADVHVLAARRDRAVLDARAALVAADRELDLLLARRAGREVADVQLARALEDGGLPVPGEVRPVDVGALDLRDLRALAALDRHRVEIRDLLLLGDEVDRLGVGREERPALVARRVGQAARRRALRVRDVDVVVARALVVVPVDREVAADVDDLRAVGRVAALARAVERDPPRRAAVQVDLVQVRAAGVAVALGREEDLLAVRRPVAHRLEAAVEGHALGQAARDRHDEDVVVAVALGRERDLLAVRAHAGQGVLGLVDREPVDLAGRHVADPDVAAVAEDGLLVVRRQGGVAQARGRRVLGLGQADKGKQGHEREPCTHCGSSPFGGNR